MHQTFRRLILVLPCALALACGTQTSTNAERAFQADWAETWCDRQESCATQDFEDDWDDHDDCVTERSDDAKFSAYWGDLVCGAFSQADADACIEALETDDCESWAAEDWRDACGDVYGC